MEPKKVVHLMYCPWTGLGLYNGFRGNRWLRNRIQVFKQFVIPSLQAQSNQNFILWCSWRPEEKHNKYVVELIKYLDNIKEFKTVHTFHGVCFWDDKYKDVEANDRLMNALHGSMGELVNHIGDCDEVIMTIQPSDDIYHKGAVQGIQEVFEQTEYNAFGFTRGYIMNYTTGQLAEYNPETNPPFFSIRFPKEIFIDPFKHAKYTGPYRSHEYVGNYLKYGTISVRGFLVGTHGENISTIYNHPYRGDEIINYQDGHLVNMAKEAVLNDFGISGVPPLKIKSSIRKRILRKLPHKVQRKLRYVFGERFWQKIYDFLRN